MILDTATIAVLLTLCVVSLGWLAVQVFLADTKIARWTSIVGLVTMVSALVYGAYLTIED